MSRLKAEVKAEVKEHHIDEGLGEKTRLDDWGPGRGSRTTRSLD